MEQQVLVRVAGLHLVDAVRHAIGGDVLGDDCAGPDDGVLANNDGTQHLGTVRNLHVGANHGIAQVLPGLRPTVKGHVRANRHVLKDNHVGAELGCNHRTAASVVGETDTGVDFNAIDFAVVAGLQFCRGGLAFGGSGGKTILVVQGFEC